MAAFLVAEELQEPYLLQEGSILALDVDADFTWETVKKPKDEKEKAKEKKEAKATSDKEGKKAKQKTKGKLSEKEGELLPTTVQDSGASEEAKEETKEDPPFEVKGLRLSVPKGSFVGIVGRVGSGKVRLYTLVEACTH
jgi:ATP-binding cassette, subfamily C (CFTR/MRP), member 1